VRSSIFEKFRDALVRQVESYTVGDGFKAGISHGPLQNDMRYSRVKTFFDDIEKQGWKVATGGRIEPSYGYMVTPTIIDRPPDNSRIVVEGPFGEPKRVYGILYMRAFANF
jgi:acyl-CoA reductase-like NAD-dependent aldehyde dehydrogenase